MSSRNRIPPAIEPLLRLRPGASLTVITGTLGCSPTWLTSRFIGSLLGQSSPEPNGCEETCNRIVFVSWMRDLGFWKNDIRRTTGLDISKAIEKRQLAYIDGLTGFKSQTQIDVLSTALKSVTEAISRVSISGSKGNLVLILDNPDLLLASADTTAHDLDLFMLKLRSLVHSTLLICSADQPLVQPAASSDRVQSTPLEVEGSRFLTQQAHNAHMVMSVHELATGAAKDISGVLRVSRSSGAYVSNETALTSNVEEMEALYLVSRDGTVRVFQRGAEAG